MRRDRLLAPVRTIRRAVLARRRLLAALLTAVAVATGIHAAATPPPATVDVLVAAHDLPAGVVVEPDDLRTVGFTPGSLPTGVAHDPGDAVGRTLAAPLRTGEPLTDVRLVGSALTEGYPGLSAVPVRLPDSGMADLLRVGDIVDLVSADPQGGAASIVATGVPVLAVPVTAPEVGASGLPGRLVVVGAEPGDVARIADASARTFLTVAFPD